MSEQDQLPKPGEESNKSFREWTDEEMVQFGEAFSLEDFEIMKQGKQQQDWYIKVKVPHSVEPKTRGLITAEHKTKEAFSTPTEKESQETMKGLIGNTATIANLSEEEEAEYIQKFGQFTEIAGLMAGKEDPAFQDLRQDFRLLTLKSITSSLRTLLVFAASCSWDKYIDQQKEKYPDPKSISKEAENEIFQEHERYRQVTALLDKDPFAGQAPRFLVASASGQEIFRSAADLK